MDRTFSIDRSDLDARTTVLRVSGHMDARHAAKMLEDCATARSARRDLILNLASVTFIASSGIGALLALSEEFRQSGLQLCLADPSPPVDAVLRLLNLDQFLRIESSEQSAVQGLRAA